MGVVNGTYEQWAALDAVGRKAFIEALGQEGKDPSTEVRQAWEPIKLRYPMAFQVVFQKAVTAAISECYDLRQAFGEMTGMHSLGDADPETFANAWTSMFNDRMNGQLETNYRNSESIFDGSVVTPARTISFTEASRKALTAAIVFAMLAPLNEWQSQGDAEVWVKKSWLSIKRGQKSSDNQRLLSEFGSVWKKALVAYERSKLRSAGQDFSDKAKLEKLAQKTAARLLFNLKP
jgi:hypothetical protein